MQHIANHPKGQIKLRYIHLDFLNMSKKELGFFITKKLDDEDAIPF